MFEGIDLVTVLASFLSGSIFGSLITYQIQKKHLSSDGSGNVVDQSAARAGGDIAGRDKRG